MYCQERSPGYIVEFKIKKKRAEQFLSIPAFVRKGEKIR